MIGLLGFLNTSFPAIGNADNVHSSVSGHENQEENVIIEKKKKKGNPSGWIFWVGVVTGGRHIERDLLASDFCH